MKISPKLSKFLIMAAHVLAFIFLLLIFVFNFLGHGFYSGCALFVTAGLLTGSFFGIKKAF